MAKCKGCRKMILVQWWGRDPLPLPPKPFTPRSLVGMTMGARKRAWLSNALYPVVFPSGIVTDETEMQAGYSWQEIRDDWPLLGQRLRPCPGCEECRGYDDGIGVLHCDGSGVLPATKTKRPD